MRSTRRTVTLNYEQHLRTQNCCYQRHGRFKRAIQPLELSNFFGALYSESLPTQYNVGFTLNDPNTNVATDCDVVWANGEAGTLLFNCSNPAYQVNFPDGIYDIEDFVLRVSRADGTEAGQNTVSGDD
ncbi:uncharacterized protein N7483_012284 [Penicillium malachiteum]|uniref:uncharacterized protein n=1 Tax=Penicillium malachiteum TaxID=1324776 RepID=UPI002546E0B5|nr:uncharacterized protein N7483_012284 [Penicillium malachiteum]KAJ5715103.1 hypothetical protein N7483_012284 [Penicillium malachiteum]